MSKFVRDEVVSNGPFVEVRIRSICNDGVEYYELDGVFHVKQFQWIDVGYEHALINILGRDYPFKVLNENIDPKLSIAERSKLMQEFVQEILNVIYDAETKSYRR